MYKCIYNQDSAAEEKKEEEAVVHEDNEWGICLVDEDVQDKQEDASTPELTTGVRLAYTVPKQKEQQVGLSMDV